MSKAISILLHFISKRTSNPRKVRQRQCSGPIRDAVEEPESEAHVRPVDVDRDLDSPHGLAVQREGRGGHVPLLVGGQPTATVLKKTTGGNALEMNTYLYHIL